MKWSDLVAKGRFIKFWRFKKVHYLFAEMGPELPLFIGIHFIETKQYFFQSQN